MHKSYKRIACVVSSIVVGAAAAVFVGGGCDVFVNRVAVDECAASNESAVINVAGVFRYSGDGVNANEGLGFSFSGTITFEQEGDMVRVSDTSYDSGSLRSVAGKFTPLEGNTLDAVLSPTNGDDDYVATVRFIFSDDGEQFCVQFMDTNNDQGSLGSFVGRRVEE